MVVAAACVVVAVAIVVAAGTGTVVGVFFVVGVVGVAEVFIIEMFCRRIPHQVDSRRQKLG